MADNPFSPIDDPVSPIRPSEGWAEVEDYYQSVQPVEVGTGWAEPPDTDDRDESTSTVEPGYATRQLDHLREQNLDWVFRESSEWVFAPDSSHMSRWLAVSDPDSGSYVLMARFKERHGVESRTYVYFFPSIDELESVNERLRRSLHPYSSVMYPQVIQAGVPYQ
jgi:hypothetical protein